MRNMFLLAVVLSAIFAAPSVRADDTAGPVVDAAMRGEAVVDQWCRYCHPRASDPPDPVMAPSFEEIVRRKGHNRAYFTQFLKDDHFPMTTFRLFDDEKADVVEYLLSLQQAQR